MIVDKTDVKLEGNLAGERIAMGVDASALVHIMGVLTNLYSDPELAVIREYSTNALDAQIEAGVNRPIEVETPSNLSPFFRVRDFGVGLSSADIAEIYSQYGASTKRGTNTQTGMLGLGCKSALAYTNQFTLTSVKDGIRTQVVVTRDDTGAGNMTVVSADATEDPDGTEVCVPVKRLNDFHGKAAKFFRFWKPGTVLLNGQPPKALDGLKVSDKLVVIENEAGYYQQQHKIVMGNVAYPATLEGLALPHGSSLVAYVDIGSVNFVPSREALEYTDKTKATLKAVVDDFASHANTAVQREVDKCTRPYDALLTAKRWHQALCPRATFSYTFKGTTLPDSLSRPAGASGLDRITVVPRNSHVLNRHSTYAAIPAEFMRNAYWCVGYDLAKFTSGSKKKVLKFFEDKGDLEWANLILSEWTPDKRWVPADRIVKWEDIRAVKLPRAAVTRSGRPTGAYEAFVAGSWTRSIVAGDIDTEEPIYYLNKTTHSYNAHLIEVLCERSPGCTVVLLPESRIAKFLRNFPEAEEAWGVAREHIAAWAKSIGPDQLRALAVQSDYTARRVERLDPKRVDDPDLVATIKAAKLDVAKLREQWNRNRYVADPLVLEAEDPLDKYPLMDYGVLSYDAEHVYNYLNDAYRRAQDN